MDCSLPGSSVHGDSPSMTTGVGGHVLLQGIFLTQGSNPGPSKAVLYHLSHQGSPNKCFRNSKKKGITLSQINMKGFRKDRGWVKIWRKDGPKKYRGRGGDYFKMLELVMVKEAASRISVCGTRRLNWKKNLCRDMAQFMPGKTSTS